MNDEATRSTESTTPSRILVADDHPLLRSAIKHVLGLQPDLEVVGEAADGQEALELCRRLRPDLVLMDMTMPRMDGREATRAIKEEHPQTIVLMLTASIDSNHMAEAVEAGAAGYVLKSANLPQMIGAVRGALAGESPLDQGMAMELLRRAFDGAPGCEEVPATGPAPREWTGRTPAPSFAGGAVAEGGRGPRAAGAGTNQPGDLEKAPGEREHGQEARAARYPEAEGLGPHPGRRARGGTRSETGRVAWGRRWRSLAQIFSFDNTTRRCGAGNSTRKKWPEGP